MNRWGCDSFCESLARRHFLRIGSLSLVGIHLSQYLEMKGLMAASGGKAAPGRAQACILLLLEGGPSQVDTWDPKPSSGFRPIGTNVPGIQISEILPRVARHMDKLSIIRSMTHEEVDHPLGREYITSGHRPAPAMEFASVGSIVARELGPRNGIPPYVLGAPHLTESYYGASSLGAAYNPLVVPDPSKKDFKLKDLTLPKSITEKRIEDRRSFLEVVDGLYRRKEVLVEAAARETFRDKAMEMILSPTMKKAFDLSQESEKTKDAYGRYGFGQSALLARRLVEAGSRFVTAAGYNVDSGWDTHGRGSGGENDKKLRALLCPTLDQTLTALLIDLDQRGLLESTIVMAMGEFGRTPEINPINGRDHWPFCWSMVLGGGGLQGGQVIGSQRREGRIRGRASHLRGRCLRHHLQGHGHRLDQGIHDPGGSARQDRQLLRRHHRPAHRRVDLARPCLRPTSNE